MVKTATNRVAAESFLKRKIQTLVRHRSYKPSPLRRQITFGSLEKLPKARAALQRQKTLVIEEAISAKEVSTGRSIGRSRGLRTISRQRTLRVQQTVEAPPEADDIGRLNASFETSLTLADSPSSLSSSTTAPSLAPQSQQPNESGRSCVQLGATILRPAKVSATSALRPAIVSGQARFACEEPLAGKDETSITRSLSNRPHKGSMMHTVVQTQKKLWERKSGNGFAPSNT